MSKEIEREKRFFLSINEVVSFLARESLQSPKDTLVSLLRIDQYLENHIPTYQISDLGDFVRVQLTLTDIVGKTPLDISFNDLKTKKNGISDTYFRTDYLNNLEHLKYNDLLPIDKKVIELAKHFRIYYEFYLDTSDEIVKIKEGYSNIKDNHLKEIHLLRNKISDLESILILSEGDKVSKLQETVLQLEDHIQNNLPESLREKENFLNNFSIDYEEMLGIFEQIQQSNSDSQYRLEEMQKELVSLRNSNAILEEENNELKKLKDNSSVETGLYKLINVMRELLLDQNINTETFIEKDKLIPNKKPTQAGLVNYIVGLKILGLQKRTLDGIFAKAKKFIE